MGTADIFILSGQEQQQQGVFKDYWYTKTDQSGPWPSGHAGAGLPRLAILLFTEHKVWGQERVGQESLTDSVLSVHFLTNYNLVKIPETSITQKPAVFILLHLSTVIDTWCPLSPKCFLPELQRCHVVLTLLLLCGASMPTAAWLVLLLFPTITKVVQAQFLLTQLS